MTEPTPYERVKNCDHDLVHKTGNNYKSCTKCGLNCDEDEPTIEDQFSGKMPECEHEWLDYAGGQHSTCNKCGAVWMRTDGLNCTHEDATVCTDGSSECRTCGLVLSLSHTEAMKVNAERDRQLDALIGILTDYCHEHPEVIDKFFAKGKQ